MKTAEQFLEECKTRWKQTDPNMQSEVGAKQALIDALILYAEQAIDECSTKLWDCVESYDDGGDSDSIASDYYINCQPIIDVKKLLK
jgi:hypothetical protein